MSRGVRVRVPPWVPNKEESKMDNINFNRIYNSKNLAQGEHKKVLCVCSAGLLRSPTIAFVLSQDPFNFNTRAVGISSEYALVPLDAVHLFWADEIVCADADHEQFVRGALEFADFEIGEKPIHCLNIPDRFKFRDPKLVQMIQEKASEVFKATT